jgi:FkbM family methyltransferase
MKIKEYITSLIVKIDKLQNDLEFVKNHSSSYLGNGIGLTHLVDETPIYINTDDFGCPSNFINGGKYEEEYYHLLASFRNPETVFLDIGANLGVFSLRFSKIIKKGKIIAFEPNPTIYKLLSRSIHLNGLSNVIKSYNYGASDKNFEGFLSVPSNHAGGASISENFNGTEGFNISAKVLDELLSDLDHFDIAKIDVEGHELNVLKGMSKLLARSKECIIIFEKLQKNSGIEESITNFLSQYEMLIYKVDGYKLKKIGLKEFVDSESYFIASREKTILNEYDRNFIVIYPDDMHILEGKILDKNYILDLNVTNKTIFMHGPYWFMQKGTYKFEFDIDIIGSVNFSLTEKFGYQINSYILDEYNNKFDIIVERDLTNFEIVFRSDSNFVKFKLRKIKITRLG